MRAAIFKVKEGKLEQWKNWCTLLASDYREEALTSLKEENAFREFGILLEQEGEHYVVGVTEYFDTPLESNKHRELNQKHKEQLRDCLIPIARGAEYLFDLRKG